MNDIDIHNEAFFEEVRADFYKFLQANKWDECRAILAALEEQKQSTWHMRKDMNLAMAEDSADHDGAEKEMEQERARENDHESHLSSYAD